MAYHRRGDAAFASRAMTVDDIDIFRSAKLLIDKHGDDAALIAIKRATKMLDAGNVDGYAVWKRILRAIEDMKQETPRPGEHQH